MDSVVALWSFAVFLASVFAGAIIAVTLTPKVTGRELALRYLATGILGFLLCLISYSVNLYNDFVGILVLSILLCLSILPSYSEGLSAKLFVGMMAALIANIVTFMFCGTTDTFLGGFLDLFDGGSPYNTKNILLFIGIKFVIYSLFFWLYIHFFRAKVQSILKISEGQLKAYLVAPAVSIIGFYVINLVTNSTGIVPTNLWFFPLYLTICMIFVVEYVQIFTSVKWTAEAMKIEKEKERIGAELSVATQIQADMLPSIFPAFPGRKEFDIYASMNPAKEVGGDFYDFFLIDDDHLALVIADVSGKGVPAALFMVIAKTLIKNHAQTGEYSPARILAAANGQLCEGNEAELFVTVWLAILKISTGKGKAANAGHEHPAIRRSGGKYELLKYCHSPAVATMEGIRFKEHDFELNPGDCLFVYTDGVPEATNAGNELYGTDRMLAALNKEPDAAPSVILANVQRSVDEFVAGAPQFDALTMLGLSFLGKGEKE